MLRNFFRASSWEYANASPTAFMTATVIVLLIIRYFASRNATSSTVVLRCLNACVVVSVVVFGLLVYARFVTHG